MILVLGLEFPVVLALLDCVNRGEDHFDGGADDRAAWVRWLAIATVLAPLYGLALTGLYGARHGRFGPRPTRK